MRCQRYFRFSATSVGYSSTSANMWLMSNSWRRNMACEKTTQRLHQHRNAMFDQVPRIIERLKRKTTGSFFMLDPKIGKNLLKTSCGNSCIRLPYPTQLISLTNNFLSLYRTTKP